MEFNPQLTVTQKVGKVEKVEKVSSVLLEQMLYKMKNSVEKLMHQVVVNL
jgi:hypothetical protein